MSDSFSLGFFFIYCSAKRRRFALIIYKKKKKTNFRLVRGSVGLGLGLGLGSLRNKPNFRLKLGLLGLRAELEPSFSSRAQARALAQGLNYQP